ncbi:hypothetical protein N7517_000164 [Penicillium concentricum]|uniref:3-hydroxyisobutyrate dehydrogenase n=1 Tax=Penicillium concentricum TaxID=293559 RepID=A0A9W9VHC9_9EURO|nr:uncharacterized protein N7517_000164 [Penicillium concentricum]KAJ5382253.1 hypothetical protein N7517_000164 [Penicillium concentricum]
MASDLTTIAFIGLGVMGYPMAINLRERISSNTKILVNDVSVEAIERYQKETKGKGTVEFVKSGFEAAKVANLVIAMLPNGRAVETVYLDPETGILAGVRARVPDVSKEVIIMECGTIESDTINKIAEATRNTDEQFTCGRRVTFVDAPVSGGPMGAQAGNLTFMVGCTSDTFETAKYVLSHMGSPGGIFHCGEVGSGTAFKVINNYLSAITSLAASEALNIGAKMGLDLKQLTDVINVSGGQCWVTSKSNPVPGIHANAPASRDYEGGFRIELCRKVLKMGSDLGKMVGARTILDKPTLDALDEAAADPRYKGKDARVVYKWLNEQS